MCKLFGLKKETKQKRKLSFKEIAKDQANWVRYQEASAEPVTADQLAEGEKREGCGELRNGYRNLYRPGLGRAAQSPI